MNDFSQKSPATAHPIGLDALSDRQRRLVEANLPLVYATLHRMFPADRDRRRSYFAEYAQEGALALMQAVRSHDPSRHGAFGPYVMSRVQFAVSRHTHEDSTTIRVPLISQRRRKARRAAQSNHDRHNPNRPGSDCERPDRHDLSPPLRVRSLTRVSYKANHRDHRIAGRGRAIAPVVPMAGRTLADVLRERIDAVMARVAAELKADPAANTEIRHVIASCSDQRWTIPDPDSRTPLRKIASDLNCSLGRVTRCESRFFQQVAAALKRDPVFIDVSQTARESPDGWSQIVESND